MERTAKHYWFRAPAEVYYVIRLQESPIIAQGGLETTWCVGFKRSAFDTDFRSMRIYCTIKVYRFVWVLQLDPVTLTIVRWSLTVRWRRYVVETLSALQAFPHHWWLVDSLHKGPVGCAPDHYWWSGDPGRLLLTKIVCIAYGLLS